MAGLTTTGITIKDVDEIVADLESAEISAFSDSDLNVQADSVLGQLNGIYGAALAELWSLVEEVYQSAYPDTASGQSLSYVAALTGAIRAGATKATVTANLTGTSGATVPAGTQFYPDGDADSLFQTTAAVVLTGGFATPTLEAVAAGPDAFAAENEPLVIKTPTVGLDTAATPSGGSYVFVRGSAEETDAELRFRREQALAVAANSTVEAIRANMLTVTGVDSCTVFENPTSVTDTNGLPPHSIEVLVYSSVAPNYTAQDVADMIWASKPAGTETYGTETPVTVTDSQGNSHSIEYSEPANVALYIDVALTKVGDGSYVGDSDVGQAIADWALSALQVGDSVYASDIINVVADITGVKSVNVAATFVDDSASPSPSTSWVADVRELGTVSTANINVTST